MTRGREVNSLWFLFPAAVSAAVVAAMTRLGARVGAIDHPGERSSHTRPTPKGGGLGIVLATLVCGAGRGLNLADASLLVAATGLAAFCWLDDLRDRGFRAKLAAQGLAAAVALTAAGIPTHGAAGPSWADLPYAVAAPAALGWILFVTNAVNFLDGLNGLASGAVGLGLLALWLVRGGDLALGVVAGVAGFLPFNFPRARIFMGDVGSQFLGFVAACLALRVAGEPNASLVLPFALLPLLLDAAFTLARRAIGGHRLTQAHRGHLYQVANRVGVPAPVVTVVHWGLAGWGGAVGAACGAGVPLGIGLPGVVLPALAWGSLVIAMASRRRLGRWG